MRHYNVCSYIHVVQDQNNSKPNTMYLVCLFTKLMIPKARDNMALSKLTVEHVHSLTNKTMDTLNNVWNVCCDQSHGRVVKHVKVSGQLPKIFFLQNHSNVLFAA